MLSISYLISYYIRLRKDNSYVYELLIFVIFYVISKAIVLLHHLDFLIENLVYCRDVLWIKIILWKCSLLFEMIRFLVHDQAKWPFLIVNMLRVLLSLIVDVVIFIFQNAKIDIDITTEDELFKNQKHTFYNLPSIESLIWLK